MVWINWGPDDPSQAQNLMRVTETGAILTQTPVPREHLYLAILFAPDTVAMSVVAASQQAHEARAEIIESFSHWGVLNWPDDPADYWTNDANPVDEPAVSLEIPDDVPGPGWPTPLTEADLHWSDGEGAPAGEDPEGEESWSHKVDLDSTEGNEAEEDALEAFNPPLSPIAEGAPPSDEEDPPPIDPEGGLDDGDDGEGRGGEAFSVADRVARALARRPAAPPDQATGSAVARWLTTPARANPPPNKAVTAIVELLRPLGQPRRLPVGTHGGIGMRSGPYGPLLLVRPSHGSRACRKPLRLRLLRVPLKPSPNPSRLGSTRLELLHLRPLLPRRNTRS